MAAALLAQGPPQGYPQAPYPDQGQAYPQQGYPPQNQDMQQDNGPADEPGRAVARLGILNGDASVKRGDSGDWVAAVVNAPLMSGDEVSVSQGSRAEIQVDAANFLRAGSETDFRLENIDNGQQQVQLSRGLITWRTLRDSQAQVEISTPLVAVHPGRLSSVRVEVMNDGTTRVTVRRGDAEVSTPKGAEHVNANSTMIVQGAAADPEFQIVAASQRDDWDGWSDQRDKALLRAQSPRYVTQDMSGAEDLDAYGNWNYDPQYGWVWNPTVASTWAPYQDGQWAWEDYYGWTWIDQDPWGWAPFHYGYWYNRVGYGWSWWPGPRVGRTWWRPAMVGFFGWGGGVGVGFGFGNVGWVPLAPYEAFRPWYGRGGFRNINVSIVRNANVYNTFRNARVGNGVTAVSAADFQRGSFGNHVAVDRGQLQQASIAHGGLPMTPGSQNLRFSNRTASVQSPRAGITANQHFFGSRNTDAGRTPFTQQQAAVRGGVGTGFASAPTQTARPQTAPAFQQGNQRGPSSAPGWNRFGGSAPDMGRNSGVNNPGVSNPGTTAPRQEYRQAPQQEYRQEMNRTPQVNQPRQYQVSPPIVRERPQQMQSPQQMQRPQQMQSAPQMQRAPQQQMQRAPAPQFSQPRMSQPQGGGGGFRGGGGGGGGQRGGRR